MAEQLFKTVEIDGETYMIRKFTAITGLQIARLIISKMAPIIPALSAAQSDAPDALAKNVELLSQCLDSISDDEIAALTRKCLKVCKKKMAMGYTPCLNEDGTYGVEGLEYNLSLTLRLCFEAISWGASDFFAASGLGSILSVSKASSIQPNS